MSAAKKAKTEPVFPGKIDGVDKPLLQTLATVCEKLYDEKLHAEFKPKDGAESNEMLDQPYELSKKGGEYTDNGHVISGYDIFNHNTEGNTGTASLAEFGQVIDGITDFHGEFQPAFPPFAALIVRAPACGLCGRRKRAPEYRSVCVWAVTVSFAKVVMAKKLLRLVRDEG